MYQIVGNTNYESTEGPEIVLASADSFEEALRIFKDLAQGVDSLDFSYLDEQVDEWIKDPDWEKDLYFGGFYGGSIALIEASDLEDDSVDCRVLVTARRERNPYTKEMILYGFETEDDITNEELEVVNSILRKTEKA